MRDKDISWIRADKVEEMLRQKDEEGDMAGLEREMIERMTRMEVTLASHQKSTDEKFKTANDNIQSMGVKVDKMYEVLTQAKGAKLLAMIGLAGLGGLFGAKASTFLQAIGFKFPQ